MQVKTYVYGTPLGFNFYEDDSLYKDYFKGFYISSREGRRLMVNRLDNGETTYNFLCYRIAEAGNRPNAFFGMSLVLGDYQYCSDFSKLYDWFNFLFNKLIKERKLFNKQGSEESGLQLQYNVAKFAEDTEDVEWLKANIPNILSSPEIKLSKYDASFSNKVTGKIAQFNNVEKPENILKAFKQYRWICLSPLFTIDSEPELDYDELSKFLQGEKDKLLRISISREKKDLPVLQEMLVTLKENYKNISDFVAKAKDEDRINLFVELGKQYYDILANQLPQIAQKIEDESGKNPPPPSLKTCSRCGKQKPISVFAEGDSICAECRANETQEETRICQRCRKKKPIGSFSGGDTICIECRNHEKPEPTFPFPLKYVYGGIAAIVLVVIITCVIKFWPSGKEDEAKDSKQNDQEQVDNPENEKNVDATLFNDFIAQRNFSGAYTCIKGKEDADAYKTSFKKSYETYLISQDLDKIQEKLITDRDLCTFAGIDDNKWEEFVKDGTKINTYLSKANLTTSEKGKCNVLINKYRTGIFNAKAISWAQKLSQKRIQPPGDEDNLVFTYSIKDGNQVKKNLPANKAIGIVCKAGEYVDLFSIKKQPNCIKGNSADVTIGYHPENSPSYYRIVFKKPGQYIFNCGDNIALTINVTAKYSGL